MTPQELKNSILQLAIQGKLVPQRPEEGNAEELYKQIQAEKQKLIKEGKIKKEKPLPPITDNEKPFEIPASWKWVRLKEIVYNHGQITPLTKFSYIDIGSIDNIKNRLNNDDNILEPKNAPSRARKIVKIGDILYSTVRPYLHNICIIDRNFKYVPIASTGFAVMSCYSGVYNKYLFHYLLSPAFDSYANNNKNSKGVAYPAINDTRLYIGIVPLPPLAEQKRIVAYHEIGHALVAARQKNSAPVHKITIVPRTSGALGYTMQVSEDDNVLMSKEELFNKITTLTGGRSAEEVIFKSITTGASNDIEQATRIARAMVTRFGMTDEFDMMATETVTNAYLGGDTSLACSETTSGKIDAKVMEIIKDAHAKARAILENDIEKLHELSAYLLEKETITGEEFMYILEHGRPETKNETAGEVIDTTAAAVEESAEAKEPAAQAEETGSSAE